MGNFIRRILPFFLRNRVLFLFVCFWCTGLVAGTYLASLIPESFLLLMRTAGSFRVSIVGLFASVYLPFLLSAFAVYIGRCNFLYIFCLLKALLFALSASVCVDAYNCAGWLVHILLQFSDILLLPVLCWFSIRSLTGCGGLKRDFSLCSALYFIVGSMDYCIVSPFLVMLIDH